MNPQTENSSTAAAGNPQSLPNSQSEIRNPKPMPPGRPRKLDEISQREICALISAGCGIEETAQYVGCAPSTIRREAARNAPFNEELRRAQLAAELTPLNAMRRAAATHWRAAAWLLERTNPQRFARQDVRYLKPEQIRHILDMLRDIYDEEVRDPETSRRILERFNAIVEALEHEALAARSKSLPEPRCRGRQRPPLGGQPA